MELKQSGSVTKYISELRNLSLTVRYLSEGETFDKTVDGLKYYFHLEIIKITVVSFEEALQISLRVDSAIWRERGGNEGFRGHNSSTDGGPPPMKIVNVTVTTPHSSNSQVRCGSQRQKDVETNAFFNCHQSGCRPWKHKTNTGLVNNVGIEPCDDNEPGPDSEEDMAATESEN